MYRFLLTPRWLGALALTVAASVVMVFLGNWQLHRYHERSEINDRIDAADSSPAVPMTSVLAKPAAPGQAGASPGKSRAWTKITVTGRYDPAHEVQARGRTVDGNVGFEILTPLVLADGTAVLVDRGWVPPASGDALSGPLSKPAPTGEVTVVGQLHLTESRPSDVIERDGRLDTRRVSLPRLAAKIPYPLYGAYVLQSEPAQGFSAIPIDHEDSWQNGGYAVQWWLFAVLALVMYGWQARKEANGDAPKNRIDRVAAADDKLAASSSSSPSSPSPGAPAGSSAGTSAGASAGSSAGGDDAGPVVPAARRAE
ncbi:SURF1 family cytochrome oxidase biogenesis protein [Symbioplanes lichenis]|uniref:SURF1 family cytochrome oxidase biogenesis protein n=1 Tax=Symbioplanes lichenis TaxID=1629072 RepID=UPI00273A1AC3|nr:SURF1 family protein [Actinoplanes lichenis]